MKNLIRLLPLFTCLLLVNTVKAQPDTMLYPFSGTETGKTAYYNASGKLIVDWFTGSGMRFKDGFAIVSKGGKNGAIDLTGKLVVPCIYDRLQYWPEQQWWVGEFKSDSVRIFPKNGGPDIYYGLGMNPHAYPSINRMIINSNPHHTDCSARLFDMKGKLLATHFGTAPTQFQPLRSINSVGPETYNGNAFVLLHSNIYSITDINGKILFDSTRGGDFNNGEGSVVGPRSVALIDTALRQIIPFSAGYTDIRSVFKTAYYFVKNNAGILGVIDRKGKIIVPFGLPGSYFDNSTDAFVVTMGNREQEYIAFDYAGNRLVSSRVPIRFGKTLATMPYPVVIKEADRVFRLWKNGFVGGTYTYLSGYNQDGFCVFQRGSVSGILDSTTKEVLVTNYESISFPVNGILAVREKVKSLGRRSDKCATSVGYGSQEQYKNYYEQYFYLRMDGSRLNNEHYDRVYPFVNGQAEVVRECIQMRLDSTGVRIDGKLYKHKTAYAHGVGVIESNKSEQFLVNADGKVISPAVMSIDLEKERNRSYSYFENGRQDIVLGGDEYHPKFEHGFLGFNGLNGMRGIMDSSGKILVPPIYKYAFIHDGYFLVSDDKGAGGLVATDGKILLPVKYHHIELLAPGLFLYQEKWQGPWAFYRM